MPSEPQKHWLDQAELYRDDYQSSWTDKYMIELEVKEISKYLMSTDIVLDIGCNNGWSTAQWAPLVHSIRGIDNITGFLEIADKRGIPNATFNKDDVTHLSEPSNTYDIVISVRTIINVGEWETQCLALSECVRVLKPDGLLLLSEATLQGWRKLNLFREEWGLEPIPMPDFNHYLCIDEVQSYLDISCRLVTIEDFSSSYYVGTRVLKPLLGHTRNTRNPLSHWNEWYSLQPSVGDWGIQKLMVFEKLYDTFY